MWRAGDGGVYRLLYEEVDESDVEILNIVSSTGDSSSVDEYRYPKAGGCIVGISCHMKTWPLERNISPPIVSY